MDISSAATGCVSNSRLCSMDRNPAQHVMNMTGPRIALRMAEFGRDIVLCSQSLYGIESKEMRNETKIRSGIRFAYFDS